MIVVGGRIETWLKPPHIEYVDDVAWDDNREQNRATRGYE